MNTEPIIWVILLLLGCFTGLLAGILGVSGGFLMVPALTFLGVPVVRAVATSLVSIFLSVLSGALRNYYTGQFNFQAAFQLALFGIPAAQLGAWLSSNIPDRWLSGSFSVLLLATIFLMNLRQKFTEPSFLEETKESETKSIDEKLKPNWLKQWQFAQIGFVAGLMSGLFGIGGGIVIVPLEIILIGESIQSAVSNSLGAMVAISASGLAQHTLNNHVLWYPGLCLGAGGIIGAQIGTRLLPILPSNWVNLFFRLLLFTLALYMLSRTFNTALT